MTKAMYSVMADMWTHLLPSDMWMTVMEFMTAYQRLKILAAMDSSLNTDSDIDHTRMTRRDVLTIYKKGIYYSCPEVDEFIWQWIIQSDDDIMWIDHIHNKTYRNVERHFTEEWQIYGGLLHAGVKHMSVDPPPSWSSHFVDEVLGNCVGRFDRVIDYGYSDFCNEF